MNRADRSTRGAPTLRTLGQSSARQQPLTAGGLRTRHSRHSTSSPWQPVVGISGREYVGGMVGGLVSLSPLQALGIPVALLGSVFLAFGAQFQHGGVAKVDADSRANAKTGLDFRQLLALVRRPSWLVGTLMLGFAIVLQLVSLFLAPLTVVQPLGALALVITAFLNARATKQRLNKAAIRAILLCVGGISVFVGVAAFTTTSVPIQTQQLVIVLIILACVLASPRRRFRPFPKTLPDRLLHHRWRRSLRFRGHTGEGRHRPCPNHHHARIPPRGRGRSRRFSP